MDGWMVAPGRVLIVVIEFPPINFKQVHVNRKLENEVGGGKRKCIPAPGQFRVPVNEGHLIKRPHYHLPDHYSILLSPMCPYPK